TCQPFDCNKVCTHECVCIDDYFGSECEDVNGGFSEWGSYGSCSRTCGTGSKTRTRACDNPTPVGTGSDCAGNTSETVPCSTDPCPTVCPNGSTQFSCTCRNHVINMTSENLSEVIAALKEELKVDKTKTSLSVRQKTSVEDSRTSAKTIGAVGAVMLAVPFVLIILSDLNIVYKYLSKNSAKRHTSHQV
ncbi:thrombospondin-2-like, partial [Ylistrum balloti]|uniref:thrombospondin-2-like n=1 Tax=Ylistrum balloti TaxID=509963 RepID=UPI002905E7C3